MPLTIIYKNKKKNSNFFFTSTTVRHFLRACSFYCVNAYLEDTLLETNDTVCESICMYVPDRGTECLISNKHLYFFSLTTFYLYAYILCVCVFYVWKIDTLLSLSLSLFSLPPPASLTTSFHCDVQCVCIPIFLNYMQIYIYISTYRLFCMQ